MNSFSTFFALLVFVIRLHKSKENSIVTSPFVQLIQDGKRATGSRSMVVLPLITLKSVLMRTERTLAGHIGTGDHARFAIYSTG
uniref:Secreted protein n=1 Tax=Globodera rostochiensis TaxID=31243 RepID=A0A914HTU6_GLORO